MNLYTITLLSTHKYITLFQYNSNTSFVKYKLNLLKEDVVYNVSPPDSSLFYYYFFTKNFLTQNFIANMSRNHVLSLPEWDVTNARFMQPKINDRGGKSVNIISNQTNRGLHISLPFLNTWGVSDYVDEKTGESDGKYSISLSFPSEDYATAAATEALAKLKEFENFILDSAVKNSEVWWGELMSREVAKHTFFPFIKYTRNKETKKLDLSKPPTIRAKIPFYDGRWNTEIYNIKSQLIYPADDNTTPMDHIPSRSQVACVFQCGGIWIGGKGWGLTWKLFQCVVKNNHPTVPLKGVCAVYIPKEDLDEQSEQSVVAVSAPTPAPTPVATEQKKAPAPVSAEVDDSDTEDAPVVAPVPEPTPAPSPVVSAPVPVVEDPAPAEEVSAAASTTTVKKVVKKVVKKAA